MLKRIATASTVLVLVATGAAYAATQATGTKVTLHSTSRGMVLATSTGRTLYLSNADTKSHSNCTGSCASIWPPGFGAVFTSGKAVPEGLAAAVAPLAVSPGTGGTSR